LLGKKKKREGKKGGGYLKGGAPSELLLHEGENILGRKDEFSRGLTPQNHLSTQGRHAFGGYGKGGKKEREGANAKTVAAGTVSVYGQVTQEGGEGVGDRGAGTMEKKKGKQIPEQKKIKPGEKPGPGIPKRGLADAGGGEGRERTVPRRKSLGAAVPLFLREGGRFFHERREGGGFVKIEKPPKDAVSQGDCQRSEGGGRKNGRRRA